MLKAFIIGLTLIILSGCASYHVDTRGTMISKENIDKIVLGTTEEKNVYEIFGKPSKTMGFLDGSKELIYEYYEDKIPTYLGGLVIDEKRKRESSSVLKIVIRDGKVESYNFKQREER